jgi:pimeloyl-ACP methyl ester carboxylesterase
MDGTGVLFEPFTRALRVEGLDPTVVSYSGQRVEGYDELLNDVVAALPRSEPFIVIAESFSGPLAVRLAATSPPGLRGVVLCATFVRAPRWFMRSFLEPLASAPILALVPQSVQLWVLTGGRATPELATLFRKAHSSVLPSVWAQRVREVMHVNVERELAACTLPILYLLGAKDGVVPRSNAAGMKAVNRNVVIAELDAPHLVLQTAPVEAARLVRAFVGELGV